MRGYIVAKKNPITFELNIPRFSPNRLSFNKVTSTPIRERAFKETKQSEMRTNRRFKHEETPFGLIVAGISMKVNTKVNNAQVRMAELAEEIELYMKTNRPWEDRTENAKKGLFARMETITRKGRVQIVMGYDTSMPGLYDRGEFYPFFLETMQRSPNSNSNPAPYGTFSIVKLTRDLYAPYILDEILKAIKAG